MFASVSKTFVCVCLFMSTLAGCTGGAPAPSEDQVLQDSAGFVWTFINEAKKERKSDVIQAKLSVMMEALDAQAEAFGGKLVELRDAAKTLQADLQAGEKPADCLQKFADSVSALVPEPQNLGE
ncbi:hypothetical protein EC9_40230 [Rosistilla ulvae]|uniref:Uncharacterized protein n=1 Tax=Rosistilla ulvae TaxID=1930277 RepID=A0A517M4M5_9BACT|nr:hypothetical protein [Rosistilla ulvae]QDS89822.1 hypothetical protein EC9_40230 [Rosistilla ulvae]